MTEDPYAYSKEVQQRAFTKWFNSKLKHLNKPQIEDIYTDLSDGVSLNQVLQCISDTDYHFSEKPKKTIHRRENLEIFFNECKELEISLINCGAEDIILGNQKIILGLIFTLITESQYFISGLDRDININNEILSWVRAIAADYNIEPSSVSNFSTNWKDGKLFNCILDKYDPENCGNFDECLNSTPKENLMKAFTNAKEFHNISRMLEVEDLTEVANPDSKAVFAYVSEYYNKFAHQKLNNDEFKTNYGLGKDWLKMQENDYDRYVKRFNLELEYINEINTELLRDMLKIEEKIEQQLKTKTLVEATFFKLSAVYSNINTVLELSNMPKLEKEITPEILEDKIKEELESYSPSLESFAKMVNDSEVNKIKRIEETTSLIKQIPNRDEQANEISKALQNPETDAQRRGLARKIKFLQDIKKALTDIENKIEKASIKFDAVDIKKTGVIPHPEYCSLSNLIGFEPTLKNEKISKEEFLDEVEDNLKFMDIKFQNLNLKIIKNEE